MPPDLRHRLRAAWAVLTGRTAFVVVRDRSGALDSYPVGGEDPALFRAAADTADLVCGFTRTREAALSLLSSRADGA